MGDNTTATPFGRLVPAFPSEEDDAWRLNAACIGQADLFFVGVGESAAPARTICRTCPVIEPCLDYALTTTPTDGIWGGKSFREMRQLRMRRKRAG